MVVVIKMQSGVVGIDVFDMDGKQVVSAEKLEIGNYVQFEVPTTPVSNVCLCIFRYLIRCFDNIYCHFLVYRIIGYFVILIELI